MSTITKSKICRHIKNEKLLLEAMKNLGLHPIKQGNSIMVDKVTFSYQNNSYVAEYTTNLRTRHLELNYNRLIDRIEQEYLVQFEKYMEDLRRKQEAIEREIQLKEDLAKQQLLEEQQNLKRELKLLEKARRLEEKRLKEEINEKIEIIKKRAQIEGYEIKIFAKKNKKVIQLVRRV